MTHFLESEVDFGIALVYCHLRTHFLESEVDFGIALVYCHLRPVWPYLILPTLSHKRHDFGGKGY